MARKKVTQKDRKPPQSEEPRAHLAPAMDDSSEKLASLKSLNSMLLKETVERRQQVDSLVESKERLESELTRSRSVKEGLKAELARMSEASVRMELERNLVFVFVCVQVRQHSEWIDRERDAYGRAKMEVEEKLGTMEREMSELLKEKSEIEQAKCENEAEIRALNQKVSDLVAQIDNERIISRQVCQEKDELRAELDNQIEQAKRLVSKLVETGKREQEIQGEVQRLKIEYDSVMEAKEERERRIESITRDKDTIGRVLLESNQVIEGLKREIEGLVKGKEEIEEKKSLEERKKIELENTVKKLNDNVIGLQEVEERLRASMADVEKKHVESKGRQTQLEIDLEIVVEEKNEMDKKLMSLIGEKDLVMKDLDEALKQLEDQKQKLLKMTREKVEVEEAKTIRESENADLQIETATLSDEIVTMKESCKGQNEKIKQLESKVVYYRDALDGVTIQRNEAMKDFEEEKKSGTSLRDKIFNLEKNFEESCKAIEEIKAEKNTLIGEKNDLEGRCKLLMNELYSTEKMFSDSKEELNDIKSKAASAEANLDSLLNMLRNTAALVCPQEERGVMNDNGLANDCLTGGGIKLYVAELEAIKNVLKRRESKIEEMAKEIEFLQDSVKDAHKKKSFWSLVSSATTILAAASVAYAARGL